MLLRIFAGFCFALAAIISFVSAGDVWSLGDADFESRIKDQDMVLVKFYAPWCGHCKKIAPEFEKAATILKKNDPPVTLVEVDCTEAGKETCSKHGVSGYPTLKIFKNGEKFSDYEGPRESDGIVKYMMSKAGPTSKELKTLEDCKKVLSGDQQVIIGFFESADQKDFPYFQKVASGLSDHFKFAHSFSSDVNTEYKYSNQVVIFQPARLHTKLEPAELAFKGEILQSTLKVWIQDNIFGLAGHRTSANAELFKKPVVIVYFDVDYVKNIKGSNYWRNRVIKVAKKFSESNKDITFAVSNSNDFSHELSEYGLTPKSDKPVVAGKGVNDQKFIMKDDFSVENLEKFAEDLLNGKLKAYLKSEPVPTSNDQPVKVVVAEEFDSIVNDNSKDVLIEFYAPWCGHCKSLAPKYEELAQKLSEESDIVIAKMDATANDVPAQYEVKGFPTIYFAPKGNKMNPMRYEGDREVDGFIKYLAKHSTNALTKYDRDGKKIKKKKTEL